MSPAPKPQPKAVCSGCGRPMAVLKAGRCVYCGAAGAVTGAAAAGEAARPPVNLQLVQAQAMLEPRLATKPGWMKWVVRSVAAAAGVFIALLFLGPCAKG